MRFSSARPPADKKSTLFLVLHASTALASPADLQVLEELRGLFELVDLAAHRVLTQVSYVTVPGRNTMS